VVREQATSDFFNGKPFFDIALDTVPPGVIWALGEIFGGRNYG